MRDDPNPKTPPDENPEDRRTSPRLNLHEDDTPIHEIVERLTGPGISKEEHKKEGGR